ncbi:MAG: hypothetical protein IJB41_03135 [Clostridia bacterium]|nr:hypothetical protein [Clostridia bacterium]
MIITIIVHAQIAQVLIADVAKMILTGSSILFQLIHATLSHLYSTDVTQMVGHVIVRIILILEIHAGMLSARHKRQGAQQDQQQYKNAYILGRMAARSAGVLHGYSSFYGRVGPSISYQSYFIRLFAHIQAPRSHFLHISHFCHILPCAKKACRPSEQHALSLFPQ